MRDRRRCVGQGELLEERRQVCLRGRQDVLLSLGLKQLLSESREGLGDELCLEGELLLGWRPHGSTFCAARYLEVVYGSSSDPGARLLVVLQESALGLLADLQLARLLVELYPVTEDVGRGLLL